MTAVLTPVQARTLDVLGSAAADRRTWDPEVAADLTGRIVEGVGPLAEELWVTKGSLTRVLGCEGRFVAEEDDGFAWTVPTARGSIAHKAVELLAFARDTPTALDMVDETLARVVDDETLLGRALTEFVRTLDPVEWAQLRSDTNRLASSFLDVFPPLQRAWAPVAERSMRAELAGGLLVVSGRPDLMLGRPQGTVARRVIVDWKSGRVRHDHLDDLGFYALLHTLFAGVPPVRVGTVYLDSGHVESRPVDDALLESAARRLVDGARRLVALRGGADPTLRPGPACAWCPRHQRQDCPDGAAWLRGRADGDLDEVEI